jgi:hypothetical protein
MRPIAFGFEGRCMLAIRRCAEISGAQDIVADETWTGRSTGPSWISLTFDPG